MGLTKQYLAYRHVGNFNIITSGRSNINFAIHDKTEGRYVLTAAAENSILWDMKLSKKVMEFLHEKNEVTALRVSPDRLHIAVGYSNGDVLIFDMETQAVTASLALHKSAISILRYDETGMQLVSGSLDTEIVVSDMIEEKGKARLIGHNAPVTDAHFVPALPQNNVVVSSSKDTLIKFWDLETRTCFKTIVDNRTEVWALAFAGDYLIAGCKETAMNVYKITLRDEQENSLVNPAGLVEGLSLDDEDYSSPINVKNCGVIHRASKGRTMSLATDKGRRVLACHGTNDVIESFYFCSKEEAKTRLQKRLKKLGQTEKTNAELTLSDEIKRLPSIKVGNKIKSIDAVVGRCDELRIIASCANNSLQMYALNIGKKEDATSLGSVAQCGHQSEVRAVCFSADSSAICSGSAESVKLWNQESMQCIRTVPTGYVLSLCFVPGDRHVLAGLNSGKLLIIDVGTGDILEEIEAHKAEIWSVSVLPGLQGCVTGSTDTTVKIWSFKLIDAGDNAAQSKVLSLLHENTLKLEEGVLSAKVSPNSKFVSVALLDSTEKVFFLDSFKFFLSLYGHKLPVLCSDISYDSSLIVTGSADRSIKIWGLDFGDCHRSLLAHEDSVVGIQFLPNTHMFFSCGKDGKIKQWDADTFNKIITLPGHVGEGYSLAVSPNSRYVVSCGSDRCLRLYEKTDEPIVLQDVQEEEREEMENQTLATGEDNDIPTLPGLKLPSRRTVGSEKSVELLLEALDIVRVFDASENTEVHPLMTAYQSRTPSDFLIAILQNIRASDLEEALVLLPFSYVCQFLEQVPELCDKRQDQTELISKVVIFLMRLHYKPIVNNHTLLPVLNTIYKHLEHLIIDFRDIIGRNLYALQLVQRDLEEQEGVLMFVDALKSKKQRDKKRRNRLQAKRLHIQMS